MRSSPRARRADHRPDRRGRPRRRRAPARRRGPHRRHPRGPRRRLHPRGPDEVAAVRERYGLPRDYLLWVGALQHPDPRRRVPRSWRAARADLVLVGEPERWAQRAARRPPHRRRLRRRARRAVLGRPRAPAAPPTTRASGLPAVEALACGTPVVACALRRAAGGARHARDVRRAATTSPASSPPREAAERPAPAPPHWTLGRRRRRDVDGLRARARVRVRLSTRRGA